MGMIAIVVALAVVLVDLHELVNRRGARRAPLS
jgi:hypothetical protein